jgi:hypothetical protein
MEALQLAQAQQQEAVRRRVEEAARAAERAGVAARGAPPAFGRFPEARLGVRVEPPNSALIDQLGLDKGKGQLILGVLPDFPAAKAGLQVNDILLQMDGKDVSSSHEKFIEAVNSLKANTPVEVVVLRKGKKETVKGLTLAEVRNRDVLARPPFPMPPVVGRVRLPGEGEGAVITTTVRRQDNFTTRYQEGSLIITVTGKVADGKAKVSEIQVQDGRETHKFDSADKVPEQYRDKVKNLIEASETGNLKIEVRKP